MRIAYVGQHSGTSFHRGLALERLGHDVTIVDPWAWLPEGRWVGPWLYRGGGIGSNLMLGRRLVETVSLSRPDLVWIDQGEWFGPRIVDGIHKRCGPSVPVVNYTVDDPFGGRDARRFSGFLSAVPEYDLLAVMRAENVAEARARGAREVMRVWFSADEIAHRPRELSAEQYRRFASEVVFVGTWMPERGPFMAELVRHGVPMSIWGDRWQKAPEWPQLAPYWRGSGLYSNDDYAAAILAGKISLGLLSKGNRDLHTTRSLEITALGGLFCAERTSEHLELYEDGREAVFWSNAAECAEQCMALLADEPRRKIIAAAGHARALRNGHYNERVLAQVIDAAVGQGDTLCPTDEGDKI
ncbi:glycosyltransferase [Acidithiobacillus sp. YTS05]|uniref:Glycosyltransferase n=1 Tax=Igneacidithiobacillus copahuensis TaxID=2724909 RepID=A0AAE2YPZ8_9PROT|nr:glycosyltransferase [Igneacidithiobacillus copahuensis]MBU2788022.1 glycosyltransferase [Igneacidithiobacillus copahuensis]MBU2796616.1 glycosyltransferase [Acidithiobacillus sp. VAN18-2]UTV81294.1 glycosyltransferase [Acidithiobacillus sp. YTS05]